MFVLYVLSHRDLVLLSHTINGEVDNFTSWETLAQDHSTWLGNITRGICIAEKCQIAEAQRKCAARKHSTDN